MAQLKKNYVSVVAIGDQNPQIINVDFLRDTKIISVDEPPFSELFQQKEPAIKFTSVPGLANLALGHIEFLIDLGRFQVRDTAVSEWIETKAIDIARKYFKVLSYTPLKIVGFNFNSTVVFDDSVEVASLQRAFLPEDSPIHEIISKDILSASTALRYPYPEEKGRALLTLGHLNQDDERALNFNYEFDFTDWIEFEAELGKFPEIARYCDSIFAQLLKAV